MRRARRAGTLAVVTALAMAPAAALADSEAERVQAIRGAAVPLELVRPGAGAEAERFHDVRPGEHLSVIANAYGLGGPGGWRRLFDANPAISDPDRLESGDRVRIPRAGEQLERRPLPQRVVAAAAPAGRASRGSGRQAAGATGASGASSQSGGGGQASGGVWDRLAACESGGNWQINTGNGYYGGLQFSLPSWRAVGGTGYPHEHSRGTQIAMAERLRAVQGWGAWPACSRRLGLR